MLISVWYISSKLETVVVDADVRYINLDYLLSSSNNYQFIVLPLSFNILYTIHNFIYHAPLNYVDGKMNAFLVNGPQH